MIFMNILSDTEKYSRGVPQSNRYALNFRLRPYFSEDFYPLTEVSDNLDVWCAMQFDRPSSGDGIIEVFRREHSPYETAIFELKGIDKESNYKFTDLDGGEFTISGSEIIEKGLKLTVTEKRKAKIYSYRKI